MENLLKLNCGKYIIQEIFCRRYFKHENTSTRKAHNQI